MTGKKIVLIAAGVGGTAWLYNYITTKLDTVKKLNAFMVGLQLGKIQFVNSQLLLDVKVKVRVTNGSNAAAIATSFVGSFFATDGFTKLADFAVNINNATNSIVIPANGFNDVDIDATISVLDSLATYLQNAKQIVLKATVTVNGIPIPIQQDVAVGCACAN